MTKTEQTKQIQRFLICLY